MAQPPYTVDIPGFSDVIRIPALDDAQIRRERFERLRSHVGALPGPLEWIPGAINWLDDRQDVLAVALELGKLVLTRAAPRLVPYLGWLLLVNDALNVTTGLLGAVVTGRVGKLRAASYIRLATIGRKAYLSRVAAWSTRVNWMALGVQAGQVLRSATGYGLQLGGVMGAITDAVWGAFRAGGGGPGMILRGPPPSDPVHKAGRYLLGWLQYYPILPFLSADDILGSLAAVNVSLQIVATPELQAVTDLRIAGLGDLAMPLAGVWNPASRDVCIEHGVDPDGVFFSPLVPPSPSTPMSALIDAGYRSWPWVEASLAASLGRTEAGAAAQHIATEASDFAIEAAHMTPQRLQRLLASVECFALRLIDMGIIDPVRMTVGDEYFYAATATDPLTPARARQFDPADTRPRGVLNPSHQVAPDAPAQDRLRAWHKRSGRLYSGAGAAFEYYGPPTYPRKTPARLFSDKRADKIDLAAGEAEVVTRPRVKLTPTPEARALWKTGYADPAWRYILAAAPLQAAIDVFGNVGLRPVRQEPPDPDDEADEARWYCEQRMIREGLIPVE